MWGGGGLPSPHCVHVTVSRQSRVTCLPFVFFVRTKSLLSRPRALPESLGSKQLRSGGEWASPKLRTALYAADRNGDGGLLLTELQDALTFCKLAISVPLLESLFRSLRPRAGVVGINDFMALFKVLVWGCWCWCWWWWWWWWGVCKEGGGVGGGL